MKLFYTDVFVLPLPAGHRFPMENKVEAGDTWVGLSERFEVGLDLLHPYNEGIRRVGRGQRVHRLGRPPDRAPTRHSDV